MSDTTPDPADTPPVPTPPEDAPPADDPATQSRASRALAGSERSLDRRWWWQAFVFTVVGIAIIGFQWGVITSGQAIAATWIMVVIGAALIVAGAVTAWRDRPHPDSGS